MFSDETLDEILLEQDYDKLRERCLYIDNKDYLEQREMIANNNYEQALGSIINKSMSTKCLMPSEYLMLIANHYVLEENFGFARMAYSLCGRDDLSGFLIQFNSKPIEPKITSGQVILPNSNQRDTRIVYPQTTSGSFEMKSDPRYDLRY